MSKELLTPAIALQAELEKRGWSQSELAEIIGRPGRLVSEILSGKRSITAETAHELAAAFETTAQHWMELDAATQLAKIAPPSEQISRKARLRERFPVREMSKRGWINAGATDFELENSIMKFFGISNIVDPVIFEHAARRDYSKSLSPAQQAWLFRVRQLATALNVEKYSETRLREALVRLELLMTEPEEVRHIPRILSECGVRFVIVEPIPGSKIDGACFWLDRNRSPVLGLSLKGSDQIDRFWFNLRHEIEHILRCDGRQGAVIDSFDDDSEQETESEKAANAAAADFCVPAHKMNDFYARHHPLYAEKAIVGFSRIMKRHPGIVVGQLQKRLNRWDIFTKYQVKVRNIITQTALTDGYGQSVPIEI